MSELTPSNQKLREEFNQWAARGKGDSMERHHLPIAGKALERMAHPPGGGAGIEPGDRILDLGCGSGWAARLLAARVGPRGLVVGVDVSDAMIRQAQEHPDAPRNVRYVAAPAERIPWTNDFFTHVLSIESFYYYTDQRVVLDELRRVMAPGGRLYLLLCLFPGNPNAQEWVEKLAVPVHFRSAEEYLTLLGDAGWQNATAETFLPDPADPHPDEHAYALLLTAQKP
ncbi:MAG TPA: methyltransferase domain-containing protein [Terriglobales bacterium]|nr:methyltransferase domain-containing protein [Terriglobales bacterium]